MNTTTKTMTSVELSGDTTGGMANYPKTKPSTVGEELFLVHLKRDEHMHDDPDTDDDYDVPPRRKRSKSIGEELYEIHVRRSKGVAHEDIDRESNSNENVGDGTPEEEDEVVTGVPQLAPEKSTETLGSTNLSENTKNRPHNSAEVEGDLKAYPQAEKEAQSSKAETPASKNFGGHIIMTRSRSHKVDTSKND